MYTEYPCYVLMRDSEPVAAAPLMKRQKPTAEPLFDRVKRVAHDALGKLLDLAVDVSMKSVLQARVRHHFALEDLSVDDECRRAIL